MKNTLTTHDVAVITNLLKHEFNGSQTPNNIALIAEVAKELTPDSVCVEIGSRQGYSAISFLLGNLNLELNSIDINPSCEDWIRNGFNKILSEKYINEMYRSSEWDLDKRFKFISGNSVEIGNSWDKKIQYLFIDGDHSLKGLEADFDAWEKHMDDNSFIGFHDFNHLRNDQMDVTTAVFNKILDEPKWRVYKANYQMIFFQKWK